MLETVLQLGSEKGRATMPEKGTLSHATIDGFAGISCLHGLVGRGGVRGFEGG